MYNLYALDSQEFELLCQDIMQKKLGKKLYSYPSGRDGGIDLSDNKINPKIIVQVKHYIKSSYKDLMRVLKVELEKVKLCSPEKYYICTSQSLTKNNKNEIVKLFEAFMPDELSHIIAYEDINNFLNDKQNMDIVVNHSKLWYVSSFVLSIINNKSLFIDSEELLDEIESKKTIYINTYYVAEAESILKKSNILVITGLPGSGKTTLSHLLIINYSNKDYYVRYSTSNNVIDIKNALSDNPKQKEIVLLDDFLGQFYMKLNETHINEMMSLISYIKRSQNKKLIVNSRVTILNEAKNQYLNFGSFIDDNKGINYIINLDQVSVFDKARIFISHLKHEQIPKFYIDNIIDDNRYLNIIKHTNYNPRIIEYVSKNYQKVQPRQFYEYIITNLKNSEKVWKNEYEYRLDKIDRIFMIVLYSLVDTYIDDSILKEAFNHRLMIESNIDTSKNNYEMCKVRLVNSLIKIYYDIECNCYKVSVLNPSVNDFIDSEISNNEAEQRKIMETALYYEQILKLLRFKYASNYYIDYIQHKEVFKLKVITYCSEYYYLKIAYEHHLIDKVCKTNYVQCAIKYLLDSKVNRSSYRVYANLIYDLYIHKYIDSSLMFTYSLYIVDNIDIDKAINLINNMLSINNNNYDYIDRCRDLLIDRVDTFVLNYLIDRSYEILDGYDIYELEYSYSTMEKKISEELTILAEDKIYEYCNKIDSAIKIDIKDFNIAQLIENFDIYDNVHTYIDENKSSDDSDYDDYIANQKYFPTTNEESINEDLLISSIFKEYYKEIS